MPDARFTTTIHAPYEHVHDLLVDKVARPRKYVGPVTHSTILERGDGYVLREMHQALPVPLTIRERIVEREVPGGSDTVFEFVDNERYTGTFHNILTRVPDRDDQVELTYAMEWTPRPGVAEEMTEAAAAAMVRAGVEHLKTMAENPVVVPDWVRSFFTAVDSMDADAFESWLTEDCRFRIGNGPLIVGRDAVVAASRRIEASFASMQHDYLEVVEHGDRTYVDCLVDYTTHDGATFLIPFLTVLDRADDKVSGLTAYGDLSPLRHGW